MRTLDQEFLHQHYPKPSPKQTKLITNTPEKNTPRHINPEPSDNLKLIKDEITGIIIQENRYKILNTELIEDKSASRLILKGTYGKKGESKDYQINFAYLPIFETAIISINNGKNFYEQLNNASLEEAIIHCTDMIEKNLFEKI
ncbi:MAG: hypothetical protein WC570_01690 [Patescibacteria group bacterium]